MHYITTIAYYEEEQSYCEKGLFYSAYQYDKKQIEDENGNPVGIELNIEEVVFMVEGKPCGFQEYHYKLTDFYQNHSLVPNTGLKLFYWSDVSEKDDSNQERAEKMAKMLLYGSGQQFVKKRN